MREEQRTFSGLLSRSLIETVNAMHLIHRREYLDDLKPLRETYKRSEKLFAKVQSFQSTLKDDSSTVQERVPPYEEGTPF